MLPRIDEVVWRGPWILVKLLDKASRQIFDQSWIKIYFQDKCLVEGTGQGLLEDSGEKHGPDELNILLDISDLEKGKLRQPTSLEVICDNQSQKFEITPRTRQEEKSCPIWESANKSSSLTQG